MKVSVKEIDFFLTVFDLCVVAHVARITWNIVLSPPQGEKHAAQIQLRLGGLRERQDQPQRQLQPLWQVHGHQL